MPLRDKRLVAASFSRAARRYDQVAQLQRDVADGLARWLPATPSNLARVLDLGCGTGYANGFLSALEPCEIVNLDLAEGMIRVAYERSLSGTCVVADAESLPFSAGRFDLIWSSLAVQWCEQPDQLFAELARVLMPGARIFISTLGPETLGELRSAWSSVDQLEHVNQFMCVEEWLNQAKGFELVRHKRELIVQQFKELSDLLRELKTLGAHNVNPKRRSGLGGQAQLRAMFSAYEQFRSDNGLLPATYEVHYLEMKKT